MLGRVCLISYFIVFPLWGLAPPGGLVGKPVRTESDYGFVAYEPSVGVKIVAGRVIKLTREFAFFPNVHPFGVGFGVGFGEFAGFGECHVLAPLVWWRGLAAPVGGCR